MGFPADEKKQMLALKGVGETVISRLEQVGFSSLSQLADVDPLFVTKQISLMMRSSCWHNSPAARNAISAVVSLAAVTTKMPKSTEEKKKRKAEKNI